MIAVWRKAKGCWYLGMQGLWQGQGRWCLHNEVSVALIYVFCFIRVLGDGLTDKKLSLWFISHTYKTVSLKIAAPPVRLLLEAQSGG